MGVLFVVIGIIVWQIVLITMYNFGEIDLFWLIILEIPSIILSFIALIIGWAATVDWSGR